ncbi:MAG TPA: hypothetical protein VIO11_02285 [Candidatus Methanoperedens sp.]
MDQKKIKHIKTIIIVILILSVPGYYLYGHVIDLGLAKPALILKISTNLTDRGTPMVNNVKFEQSSVVFFYKRTDSAPDFPEIDANARINKLNSAPASYWASTPYRGNDTYDIRLFFRNGKEPRKGDILILPIRVISHTGAVAYKTTAFYEWE